MRHLWLVKGLARALIHAFVSLYQGAVKTFASCYEGAIKECIGYGSACGIELSVYTSSSLRRHTLVAEGLNIGYGSACGIECGRYSIANSRAITDPQIAFKGALSEP